jgi:4-hydroxy-tetrahydrodipicolinate synthase
MNTITGAMTALITPFKNGALDTECYASLIKRQINNGIDVVVPVGTTGESATLSHSEHKECIEIAVDVCKDTQTKVLAGAGSNATSEAIDLAKFAESAGANGVLAVTPYYNKPSQEGLYQHYKAIANAIDIGVMLYNVPGRTAVDMTAQTAIRLYDDIENIFAIKEATGSVDRTISITSKRPDFGVVSGDDAINFAIMTNGGVGTISVTANLLPDLVSQLIHATAAGDIHTAAKLNADLYDINNILFCESNPIPIKAAMYIAGLMPNLEYRLPLVGLEKENYKKVEDIMKQYKIKGL